jgi:hypothetical protein
MALKFPSLGIGILLLAVLLVVLKGLGRPCMVRLEELTASELEVLLDIPVIDDDDCDCPELLLSAVEHIFCIDGIIVLLLLPAVTVFVAFVALVLVWANIIVVPGNPKNNSSIAVATIGKVKVILLPVNLSTRLAVCFN